MSQTTFKIVLLGDQNVGKTSIFTRFAYAKFDATYAVTTGVDFFKKTFYNYNPPVCLYIWDTAGQERFTSMLSSYLRDCALAIVVFDLTSMSSFRRIDDWIAETRNDRIYNDVKVIIVGNKCDLESRCITEFQINEMVAKHSASYMETSAKFNQNITELFDSVVQKLSSSNVVAPYRQDTIRESVELTTSSACAEDSLPENVFLKTPCRC